MYFSKLRGISYYIPETRGAVAEQAQEGLEELSQVEGQEQRR